MKGYFSLILMFVVSTTYVIAQGRPDPTVPQGTNMEVPEGWNVRLDHSDPEMVIGSSPDSSDIYFVNMTPGWHVTTGPAGIFYHPANMAKGDYKVHTSVHFFNPEGRNREGYGLFFAGKDLEGEGQQYVYFLIRNTGDFLIKNRNGENTEVIKDWTPSDAILIYKENSEDASVNNNLSVDVSGGMMKFFINETEVASIEQGSRDTDGVFGLRVNHSVNLHVSELNMVE